MYWNTISIKYRYLNNTKMNFDIININIFWTGCYFRRYQFLTKFVNWTGWLSSDIYPYHVVQLGLNITVTWFIFQFSHPSKFYFFIPADNNLLLFFRPIFIHCSSVCTFSHQYFRRLPRRWYQSLISFVFDLNCEH